ncbi:hypothetical protein [Prevotella jejuni]|jgi:hypothetical protein|uniref:hypothetical protein n=1 Tax=Prevotella jejuni TaxID=1177574 RepID=UPI00352C340A
MFKSKDDATLALTLVKQYFQDEITEKADYVPASLTMHLDLIDKAILYIVPNADIDELCRKASEEGIRRT